MAQFLFAMWGFIWETFRVLIKWIENASMMTRFNILKIKIQQLKSMVEQRAASEVRRELVPRHSGLAPGSLRYISHCESYHLIRGVTVARWAGICIQSATCLFCQLFNPELQTTKWPPEVASHVIDQNYLSGLIILLQTSAGVKLP